MNRDYRFLVALIALIALIGVIGFQQADLVIARPALTATPAVGVSAPDDVFIGEDFTFTVTFDNSGDTTGYGPYIDLLFPTSGMDGDDGITFISASYLGLSVTTIDQVVTDTEPLGDGLGCITHPYAKDNTGSFIQYCNLPVGDHYVTLLLPFGSFVPEQTPAELTITASVSSLADLGAPLDIQSRGGYMFGNTPLDNPTSDPSITSALSSTDINPTLFILTKSYGGPEDETATGPNYPRVYTIHVDVAAGQTLTYFDLTDVLPNNIQYITILSSSQPYSLTAIPSTTTPGGTLGLFYTAIDGVSDLTVEVQFYVPLLDADGNRVIDPFSGDDVFSCNQAEGVGDWIPLDPRDEGSIDNARAGGLDGTCSNQQHEHRLTDKSIATQKSVTTASDLNAPGISPGDILQYTIQIQISDYFAFNQVVVTDIFSDGQLWDSSFTPVFSVNGNQYEISGASFAPANVSVVRSDGVGGTGETTVTFNLSSQIAELQGEGWLVGGCVPMLADGSARDTGSNPGLTPDCSYNNGATTATITFRTVIQDVFTHIYPSGDDSVDQGDVLTNNVSVAGNLLSVEDLSSTGYLTEDDTSATSVSIPYGTILKSIYAINGNTSFGSPVLIAPGDVVTYRIEYTLPTSDFEDLRFLDYLPLPVFNATEILEPFDDTVSADAPDAGSAKFGPTDTFFAYSGEAPTIVTNGAQNSVTFNYGTYDNPDNTATKIDILFSVTVRSDPFADGLFLTNQISGFEDSTNSGTNNTNAIIQIQLTEPVPNFSKGVVWVSGDQTRALFSPATVGPVNFSFDPTVPGNCGRWSGIISSNALAGAPIGSSLSGVDAGDIALMALVVENTGSGLNGAFDVTVHDTLPAGLTLVAGSVCASDGTGDTIVTSGDLFSAGLQLIDPGPTATPAGALDPYNPDSGRNIAVITYAVRVSGSAAAGQTLTNSAALTNFAGTEGGEDHTETDLTDSASVTTLSPSFDKAFVSTEINSSGNSNSQAVIGELVTYSLTATFQEGVTPAAVINDTLDAGLAFAELVSVTASPGISSTVMTFNGAGSCSNCSAGTTAGANPLVAGNGQNITFDLGTVTNADTENAAAESITITYRAVVLNTIANQSGINLNNNAVFSWESGSLSDSAANIVIVEPDLTITKGYQRTLPTPPAASPIDAGDQVTYTITITNTSGVDAFDAQVSDTLPAAISGWVLAGVTDSAGVLTTSDFAITAGVLSTNTPFDLPVTPARTVTIQVRGTVAATVTPNQAISNTARVTWTSLDGNISNRSPFNDASDERTGAGGPGATVLDNYAKDITASFNVRNLSGTKYFVASSEAGTLDTPTPPKVTIGEIVRYRLAMRIPEGVSPDLGMLDRLPNYLQFLDDGTAKYAFVSDNSGITSSTLTAAHIVGNSATLASIPSASITAVLPDEAVSRDRTSDVDTYISGTDIYFKLGTITNTSDNDTNDEFIIVEFNALVLNVTNNDVYNNATGDAVTPVPSRANDFRGYLNVSATTAPTQSFTSGTITIEIAEPAITNLTKTITSPSPANAEAGDTVSYQVTFSNANGANASPAYDVVFTDTVHSKLSLSLASVNISSVLACAGTPSNTSAGNTITVTFAAVPPGCAVTITYSATVRSTVNPGEVLNNSANVVYSSLPGDYGSTSNPTGSSLVSGSNNPGTGTGERTGAGTTLNDYRDTSQVSLNILQVATGKTLVSSTDPNTTGNNLTIGEVARYRLQVILPQATSPAFQIRDYLPDNMTYLADGETRVAFVSQSGITSSTLSDSSLNISGNDSTVDSIVPVFVLPSGAISLTDNDPIFALGDLVNTDNDDDNEYVVIEFNARLDNVTANQLTTPATERSNYFRVSIGGVERDPSNTVNIVVVEPRIATAKSVLPTSAVQAGDTVSYTLQMSNNGTAMAYDVNFRDDLAQGVLYDANSMACTLNGVPVTVSVTDNTTHLIVDSSPAGGWDIPVGQVLACSYTATAQQSLHVNGSHTNTADADWSSLDGDPAEERDYVDSTTYNVDGTQDTATAVFTVGAPSLAKELDKSTATIGETVTYTLTLSSPRGTIRNLIVSDVLPAGMIFNSVVSITGLQAVTPTASTPNDGSAAVNLAWNFGEAAVTDTPITITYTAVVANVLSNQQGVTRTNSASLAYTDAQGGAVTTTPVTTTLTLVEPTLTIDKSFSATTPYDAGDVITYTLVVANTSGTTAYDAVLADTVFGDLPTVVSTDAGSSGAVVNAGFTGNDLTVTIDQLDNGESVTITISIVLPDSVVPGQTIGNTANLTWTSMPGANTHERSGTDGPGNVLNNYASSDSTSFSIGTTTIGKSIISTSAAHTANADLAIGELATFELLVTFPEGTIPNPIVIQDQMPAGLNLLRIVEVDTSNFEATFAVGEPVVDITAGAGGSFLLTWEEDIVVRDNNDPADNTLRIVYEARLENISGNQNGNTWENEASVVWGEGTPLAAEAVEVTVVEPELQISKTADVLAPVYGQTITYTLELSHLTGSTATAFQIQVSDVIPDGLSYVAASITAPAGWTADDSAAPSLLWSCNAPTCSLPLASTAGFTYQVTVDLPPAADPEDVLTNQVAAVWASLPDDAANDRDGSGGVNDYRDGTDVDVTVTNPDLTITKTDGVSSYVPGGSLTYSIVVSNVGNGPALGAVVTDAIPAHFSSWTWTCAHAGGASGCDGVSASTVDFSDVVDLPAGSSITYTVTANILSSAVGALTNTAIVTPAGGMQTDPTPTNNTATDTDTQNSQADLSVTKTDSVSSYVPGSSVTYTIVVSNAGPSDAPGSVVTDSRPAQISSWAWTCVESGGASGCDAMASSAANFSDTVNLPAGSSITYTVVAQIASSATGNLSNTVSVTPAAGITDPTPGNNTATDVDTQDSQADLSVTKTDGVTVYVPGESVTYTIVVSNAGPSDAPNSVISDAIPAQFSSWSWTCVHAGSASGCDGVTDLTIAFSDTVDLPAGSSITYTVTAQIASGATGNLTNTVTVTPATGITDPTPGNNTATDEDTPNSQADLSVTKTDGVTVYVPGESVTYTIVFANLGPSDAPNSVISDAIPAQFTSWSWTCVHAGGASGCDGITNSTAAFSDTVDLPAGSTITYTVTAQIASGASGDLTNTATVAPAAGITDPTPGNNSDSDTDTQYSISDVAILKTSDQGNYEPGQTITYELTISNNGPSDANNVVITETVPDHTTFVPASGWVCVPAGGGAGATCTYAYGYLASGDSDTVTFAVVIDNPIASGVTEIFNQTSVDHDSEDSDPSNNEDDITVGLEAVPDMTISKTDGYVQVAPGSTVTYTIVVANAGNQEATGVVITDTLPAGVTFVSASHDGVYDDATREITWTFDTFAAQSSQTLSLVVNVDDPFPADSSEIINRVGVVDDGSNGVDPTPWDNEDSDRDLVSSIGKVISATSQDHTDLLDVAVGEILTYQVSLTVAAGDSENLVENLVFEDILDRGMAFIGCTSITTDPEGMLVLDAASGFTLDGLCTMASITGYPADSVDPVDYGRRMVINFGNVYNNGQGDIELTIEYQVVVLNTDENEGGATFNNQALWSWNGGSLALQAPQVTLIEPQLEILKVVSPTSALVHETVTYTITIKHTDESETDAFDVLITDLIPHQLTYVPGSLQFVSGVAPDLLSDVNQPYLRIGWDVFPHSTNETVISYRAVISSVSPGEVIQNTANLSWTSLPDDPSMPFSPYNPFSSERSYVPGSSVDNYGANSSARLAIPELPDTGFAPGVRTMIPLQPEASRYTAMDDLRLLIPKQNLNLPIIGIPLTEDGWDLTWLSSQIGYLEGTTYPTWDGNTGLTAHVYNADGSAGPFVNLHLLKWGDQVRIQAFGRVYTYEVRSVERVGPNDTRVLGKEPASTLTLITCQGYNENSDQYIWRVVVKAVLVSVK